MFLKLLTFSVLFSFSGQVLHSEEYEDPFAEDSQSGNSAEALFFQLEQNILVKSATKIKQTLTDAPSIISVITADQIRYRNYQSVAEALADLPGFFVGSDHAFYDAGVRGVTGELRGKSRTLKVMINGQPISFRIETANFLGKELIPISAIDKIEVIRGPGSALYGANAFLGVVNIVTKTGEQVSGGGLATKAVIFGENLGYSGEFYAGEKFGDLDVFISVAKNRTDRSGLKLDSSQKSLNGAIPAIFEKESFDDISQPTSIFASFSYDLGKAGEISAFMNHQSIDTRASFADWGTLNHLDGVEASGNRIGLENNLLSGKYTLGFLDGKAELSVGTNYAEGKAADHDKLRKGNDPGPVISRDHYGYEGIDIFGEFRYTIYEDAAEDAALSNLIVIGGADLSEEKVNFMKDAVNQETSEADLKNFGYFGQLTGSALQNRLGFVAGARFDKHTGAKLSDDFSTRNFIKANMSDTLKKKKMDEVMAELCEGRVCYDSVNYRFGTTAKLLQDGDVENINEVYAKVLWGTAFKAPSPFFLYNDGYFTTDFPLNFNFRLKPQKVQSTEFLLGLKAFEKKLSLSITYFINNLSQKAIFKLERNSMQAVNEADIESSGLEAEFTLRWNPVELYGNFSMQQSKRVFDDGNSSDRSSDVFGYPDQTANLGLMYIVSALNLIADFNMKYVGERVGSNLNNNSAYVLDPYILLNANLATHKLEIVKGYETIFSLGVRNILDEKFFYPGYQPYYKYDVPGEKRTLSLGLEQKF